MKKLTLTLAAASAAAAFALTGCASNSDAMSTSPTATATDMMSTEPMDPSPGGSEAMATDGAMATDDAMAAQGSVITRKAYDADPAAYAKTTVVYLFSASWCPVCQATDKALTDGSLMVPAKVTVVTVDYDDATDLKTKYGVTTQHTLVQIDSSGKKVAKWTATSTDSLFSGLMS